MILPAETPLPEGLGTLMEEEEEEDATSPTRERTSLEMPVDGRTSVDAELRKQRREDQDETVKRNRRASLAPKPLKLKSRPPSLYLTPSHRTVIASSPSMPTLLSPRFAIDEATPRASVAVLPETTDGPTRVRSWRRLGMWTSRSSCLVEAPPALIWALLRPHLMSMSRSALSPSPKPTRPKKQKPLSTLNSRQQRWPARSSASWKSFSKQILRAHRSSVIAPASAAASSAELASASSSNTGSLSRQGIAHTAIGKSGESLVDHGVCLCQPPGHEQPRRHHHHNTDIHHNTSTASSQPYDGLPLRRAQLCVFVPRQRLRRRLQQLSRYHTRRSPIVDHVQAFDRHRAETASSHSATDSIASLGGVPLAVHDELKAKANRDAALLESTKKQVEMLERELANESERSAREKAELEQWNMDKEEHLFDRAQRAEAAARQAQDALTAVQAELEQTKEQMEDLQAEREVLQDDIEGWRSRCQDLEKTLKAEKVRSDDNRKLRAAARLRVKQLTDAMVKSGIEVPVDELGVMAALEMPQLDVVGVLKSPNLGAVSPVLALSPSLGAEAAPPQITKLLADMRQQIFNLAGSLEHERKQHLHAKEEVARLQTQQTSAAVDEAEGEQSKDTVSPAAAVEEESSFASVADDTRDLSNSPASSSSSPVRRSSSSVLGKNKRHVFAYDSSMGSFNQSQSSASLSMTTMTDDTVHTDVDESDEDMFSTKLPWSTSGGEGELVGLGMGNLDTLDEVEEVSEVSESVAESNDTLGGKKDGEPVWVDIEAGEFEMESDSGFQDAENAPPTPELCRSVDASNAIGSTSSTTSSGSADSHVDRRSPRPEFHREWSFDWAKSRPSQSVDDAVEDFFGILSCTDILPPLPTSENALDLPPITLPNGVLQPNARINKHGQPILTASRASVFGKRPPVARSAYMRESVDSQGILVQHHKAVESVGSTTSLLASGSRALGRMSMQALTGIGGYWSGGAATKCTGEEEEEDVEQGRASNWGWASNDELRFDVESRPAPKKSWTKEEGSGKTRRLVKREGVRPPKATPVWLLDFSSFVTAGAGGRVGEVFHL